jgi:hypothetical protein
LSPTWSALGVVTSVVVVVEPSAFLVVSVSVLQAVKLRAMAAASSDLKVVFIFKEMKNKQ